MLYNGIDLINIDRIERAVQRWGDRFLQRVFTVREQAYRHRPESLAARWAAKEATAKMLGVGVRGLGAASRKTEAVGWTDIEIVNDPSGRPMLQLHGCAAAHAQRLHITALSVSLSHTRLHAIASVVALSILTPHHESG
ncbi:MAG: holo-[acyl-carrier protein] synthase [Chloroflexi bacterium AL-W]|nr:holo-[acyl-carrier protein] synthase [Chloroflexi bacterium AL-N1]NOK66615.1 holo-[acyl-carrier protein] synthase [Chloroflexi bacterium AL-N10]NOK72003.1 holo-[acyl-carrier protein] synthase [Chloroflexi bacterium AL-N5]NOK81260.1 holo-[acyl-carrier protein] synthase [Chloroflexi bacterium AL-W]NOK89533.1 holo-[acyl-carrier protein] synthase [Chloroflexi bacterium AL-N15]